MTNLININLVVTSEDDKIKNINISKHNLVNLIINYKLQLVINKRLFFLNKIPEELYEKIEMIIISKINKIGEELKIRNITS